MALKGQEGETMTGAVSERGSCRRALKSCELFGALELDEGGVDVAREPLGISTARASRGSQDGACEG